MGVVWCTLGKRGRRKLDGYFLCGTIKGVVFIILLAGISSGSGLQ